MPKSIFPFVVFSFSITGASILYNTKPLHATSLQHNHLYYYPKTDVLSWRTRSDLKYLWCFTTMPVTGTLVEAKCLLI